MVVFGTIVFLASLSSQSAYADKDKNDKKLTAPLHDMKDYCSKSLAKVDEKKFKEFGIEKNLKKELQSPQTPSGKGHDAQSTIKKLVAKNTPAATAAATTLTTALGTYSTSRVGAITTYSNLATALKSQCEGTIAPFKVTLNTSVTGAKNTLKAVDENLASTPIQKQDARSSYNVAITTANNAFIASSQPAITSFQNQMNLAQVNLFNSVEQADQILKNAIQMAKLALK